MTTIAFGTKRIMRYLVAGFVFLLTANVGAAQNLVPNGSFENSCPDTLPITLPPILGDSLPPLPDEWTIQYGVPDFYHEDCLPGSDSATNNSFAFDQKAFMGIKVYGDTNGAFLRDYLQATLTRPLDSGVYYRFTFYVKPVNNNSIARSMGIRDIGLLITDTLIDSIAPDRLIRAEPQIEAKSPITSTNFWTAICGVYLARGGEQYITIGNFKDDNETDTEPLLNATNPQVGYYLVDYVEAVENDLPQLPPDTLLCQNARIDLQIDGPDVDVEWSDGSTGKNFLITEPGTYYAEIRQGRCEYTDSILVEGGECLNCKVFVPTAFTPNGDQLNDLFEIKLDCPLVSYNLAIFDRWGQKVFESDSPLVSWDGDNAELTGVYTYRLTYEYEFFRSTRTENKRGFFTLLE